MRTQAARSTWELEGDPRFELRRTLGSGGFGSVHQVFDRERGAEVALKLLRAIAPGEIYRFKQEFRALADMSHPNLVRLHELLSDGDRWLFTMELVEGTDALSFVRRGRAGEDTAAAFDERRLRSVLLQLIEGLTALHDAGRMHRDVKPSNVLVTHEGRVVLVDFGLAVRLTDTGAVSRSSLVGTPAYLAPELVRGAPASEASDWYAVGVLLYQALTGKLPFAGTLEQVLSDKLSRDAPAPSEIVPRVPPDLDRLCVALLARSPEDRPSGDELLEHFGGGASPRSGAREIPFVGRNAERAELADLFRAVLREGVTAVALVGGPSGIGKSALMSQAMADMRAITAGTVVLAGRCWEQESVPYKAIDGLVDPLSRHLKAMPTRAVAAMLSPDVRTLARLFPALEQVEAIAHAPAPMLFGQKAHDLRRAAFRALRDLLRALAKERPLVLAIDDLQWGDPDSGALLIELLAPPDPPPLLFVASYRSDEAETSACLRAALPALRAMADGGVRVQSISLDALTERDALALARALMPDARQREGVIAAIAREAGGRPFFIRELAELENDPSRAASRGAPSLDALVRDRVAGLPEGARALLEIVAIAGRPIARAAAARAAHLGGGELVAYGALRAARLVRRRDAADRDEIETYHDRIREAVTAGLSPEQRAEAFARLAAALDEAGGADPEALAAYFLEAGYVTRALELVRVAAEDAARHLAFDRAARLYRRALALLGEEDPDGALHVALGDALVNAGRGADAAEAFLRAVRVTPRDLSFELRRRAAEHLLLAGHMDEGTRELDACVAELGLRFPTQTWRVGLGVVLLVAWLSVRGFRFRARAASDVPIGALQRIDTCLSASRAYSTIDTLRGARFCVSAVRMALAAGERGRVFEALATFCAFAAGMTGRLPGVVRRARATAQEAAERLEDPRGRAKLLIVEGATSVMSGELVGGRAKLDEARAVLSVVGAGAIWEENMLHEFSCMALLWGGAWRDLSTTVARTLEEARARGNLHLVRTLSLRFGHIPALLADDPARATAIHAAAREGWWPRQFGTLDHFSLLPRGEIQLYVERGIGVGAYEIVEAAWPDLARSQILRVEKMALYPLNLRARAAIAAAHALNHGDRQIALTIAQEATRRLGQIRNPLAKALACNAASGIAEAQGETQGAIERYLHAAERLSAVGCLHYAAAARRRVAELSGEPVHGADEWARGVGAEDAGRLSRVFAPGGHRRPTLT